MENIKILGPKNYGNLKFNRLVKSNWTKLKIEL